MYYKHLSSTMTVNIRSFNLDRYTKIVLLISAVWITYSKGVGISLVVDRSLVGPHCPGTVRLFCEGVDLTSLRWRYNGNMPVISYFPDGTSTNQLDQTIYFIIEIKAVKQNPNDLNLANFSSCLTVNLSELQSNNITEISCGNPGLSQIEPVNVSIIEPSIPNSPTIARVTTEYQSGELDTLEIEWAKSDNFCPSYGLPFSYEVNVTTYDPVVVNHSSCGEASCKVLYNNLTGRAEEFHISVMAKNELGSSDLLVYPTIIPQQIKQYFEFAVSPKGHQLFGRCTAAGRLLSFESTFCSIQYTTDSMYRNLSDVAVGPLNTDIYILEVPVAETIYYVLFSALVNSTLLIVGRTMFTGQPDTQPGIPSWGIALIVIVGFVLMIMVASFVAIIRAAVKRQDPAGKQQDNVGTEEKLTISVESPTIKKENKLPGFWEKMYVEYRVKVKHKGKDYFVLRRYSDFDKLYTEVEKNYHWQVTEQNLKPPSKNYIYVNTDKFDKENIESRRKGLHEFLANIIKIPGISTFPAVRKFLALDNTTDHHYEQESKRDSTTL